MKTKIIQNFKIVILGLIIAMGTSYVFSQSVFNNPGCAPIGCNTDKPIHVGSEAQRKFGSLAVGGLGIVGDFTFLPSANAVVTDGNVLMADGNSGKVKWGSVIGSGSTDTIYSVKLINPPSPAVFEHYDCLGYDASRANCTSFSAKLIAPGTLNEILNSPYILTGVRLDLSMVSDDLVTLNKICAYMFPNAPYNLSFTHHEYTSEGSNGVLYWETDTSRIPSPGFVLRSAEGRNSGVDRSSNFICSSIPVVVVN